MSRPEPSATRRRVPGPERREEIVTQAMQLFARKGFRGVTTRELARSCGVSEALLYHFFAGKAELYDAIIERKIRQVPEEDLLPAEAMARGDDEGVLRAFAMGLVRDKRQDPTFLRLLLHSALEGHELSRRFYATRIASVLDRLRDYLAGRMEQGALAFHDPEVAARAFTAQVMHALILRELFGVGPDGPQDWRERVDHLVRLTLEGLQVREKPS